MTSVASSDLVGDFDLFYEAHFGDTVAMTYGFTADLGEAQDIAQEAFCRAWLRWREVSTYDNPVAWVRRVATNLAHSRWRRLRVAAAHLVRQREPEPVPAVNPDHVAVVAALRKLPAAQRRAVVLHHLMDMPVNEVAEQLDVPVGTVKSWLHRARAALADDLRVDVRGAVATPPTQEVLDRAGRRQRARIATATSTLALVIFGGLVGMRFVPIDQTPPPPVSSPTPAVSPSPTPDPIAGVNWGAATITVDVARPGCPTGRVTFAFDGQDWVTGPEGSWPKAHYRPADVAIGDLTGDGRAEAALIVMCSAGEQSDDRVSTMLVVERRDDGLHALGWAGRDSSTIMNAWIGDGVLYVDARPHESSGVQWKYEFGRVDGWRWNGAAFDQIDTGGEYPRITKLDVTGVVQQLACPTGSPPVVNKADPELVTTDKMKYTWHVSFSGYESIYAELGQAGRPYLLVAIGCAKSNAMVVFERSGSGWMAFTALSSRTGWTYRVEQVVRDGVMITNLDPGGAPDLIEYQLVNDQLVARPPASATPSPSGAAR